MVNVDNMSKSVVVIITVLMVNGVGYALFPVFGSDMMVRSAGVALYADGSEPGEEISIQDLTLFDGTILYVGGDGPDNYTYIQEAINAALDNDTIFVFNGTYEEHVVVDKPLHLVGEDKEITIIDGSEIGDVVWIYSSFVTFHGFTVANGGQGMWDEGIGMEDYLSKFKSNLA